MNPDAIGDRGPTVSGPAQYRVSSYIAHAIYVGGTGGVTGRGASERGCVWTRGGGALCGRVDSGFLGNPPRQGLLGGYMALFLARQQASSKPSDKGWAHPTGVQVVVMVEKGTTPPSLVV
jgi:hypothetical protein